MTMDKQNYFTYIDNTSDDTDKTMENLYKQECEELRQVKKDLPDIQMPYVILYRQIKEQYYKLEQELEFWKKEGDRTHLLMLEKQDELVKEILKNDQLEKENIKLKELVNIRIEDLCDSCGASSMMPMPCKVYEQALQEILDEARDGYSSGTQTGCENSLKQIIEKCEVLKDE